MLPFILIVSDFPPDLSHRPTITFISSTPNGTISTTSTPSSGSGLSSVSSDSSACSGSTPLLTLLAPPPLPPKLHLAATRRALSQRRVTWLEQDRSCDLGCVRRRLGQKLWASADLGRMSSSHPRTYRSLNLIPLRECFDPFFHIHIYMHGSFASPYRW